MKEAGARLVRLFTRFSSWSGSRSGSALFVLHLLDGPDAHDLLSRFRHFCQERDCERIFRGPGSDLRFVIFSPFSVCFSCVFSGPFRRLPVFFPRVFSSSCFRTGDVLLKEQKIIEGTIPNGFFALFFCMFPGKSGAFWGRFGLKTAADQCHCITLELILDIDALLCCIEMPI